MLQANQSLWSMASATPAVIYPAAEQTSTTRNADIYYNNC